MFKYLRILCVANSSKIVRQFPYQKMALLEWRLMQDKDQFVFLIMVKNETFCAKRMDT